MPVHRKRWLWIAIAVVAVCAVVVAATALWMGRQSAAGASAKAADCVGVGDLAHKWNELAAASLTGNAKTDDWLALRDEAREIAESVSTPSIKEQLGEWEKGFERLAGLQNDLANPPPNGSRVELQKKVADAGTQVYATAQMLRDECPNNWPQDRVEVPDEWAN